MKKVFAIAVAALCVSAGVHAQTSVGSSEVRVIRPEQMAPEQREQLRRSMAQHEEEVRKRWQAMTPQEREAALAKAREHGGRREELKQRWESATPEERREMKQKLKERFQR